tara:strand:+ start:1144 stop:1533 length:390 start_codon:yes stop_codon:yes gene_type:complete
LEKEAKNNCVNIWRGESPFVYLQGKIKVMYKTEYLVEEIDLIENAISEFDKKWFDYRFKSYDVYDYKGELFVEYITQQDHTNEGKFLLVDALEDISFKENVNIHLYYTVRDDFRSDSRNYLTKKGFELI